MYFSKVFTSPANRSLGKSATNSTQASMTTLNINFLLITNLIFLFTFHALIKAQYLYLSYSTLIAAWVRCDADAGEGKNSINVEWKRRKKMSLLCCLWQRQWYDTRCLFNGTKVLSTQKSCCKFRNRNESQWR